MLDKYHNMLDKYDAIEILKQELLLEIDRYIATDIEHRGTSRLEALSSALLALLQYETWVTTHA